MRATKLPITLLNEKAKKARVHVLETESFDSVFGKRKTRKRPKLKVAELDDLVQSIQDRHDKYDVGKDMDLVRDAPDIWEAPKEWINSAGQSKRIWNELYKVIDSSDVVIQVRESYIWAKYWKSRNG